MAANFFERRRKKLKLTQRQIAESFTPHLTPASVSAWETNVAAPSMDFVDDVASVYRVPVNEVIDAIREIYATRAKARRLAGATK